MRSKDTLRSGQEVCSIVGREAKTQSGQGDTGSMCHSTVRSKHTIRSGSEICSTVAQEANIHPSRVSTVTNLVEATDWALGVCNSNIKLNLLWCALQVWEDVLAHIHPLSISRPYQVAQNKSAWQAQTRYIHP